jgi:hypothetical protein
MGAGNIPKAARIMTVVIQQQMLIAMGFSRAGSLLQ